MKSLQIILLIIGLNSTIYAQNPYFPQFNSETDTWHYIDVNGKKVLDINLENIEDMHAFSDGMASVLDSKSHLWGYINAKGNWQIKPTYELAGDFKDEYAITGNKCTKCNELHLGIVDEFVGNIIDKSGKILLTDNSQDEEPSTRYYFSKNLGSGLFVITFGEEFLTKKNYVNIQGQLMNTTYACNTQYGHIENDYEIQAIKFKNTFYNSKGQIVLDLSKYDDIQIFSEGKTWGSLHEEKNGEYKTWNILLDNKGNELQRFNADTIQSPEPVRNGIFTYLNENMETFEYNLATKKSKPHLRTALELNYEVFAGPYQANGCRFIYDAYEQSSLLGFENKEGVFFYKKSE